MRGYNLFDNLLKNTLEGDKKDKKEKKKKRKKVMLSNMAKEKLENYNDLEKPLAPTIMERTSH